MKVVVTGGAGFLGRLLIERLRRVGSLAGDEITDIVSFDVPDDITDPEAVRVAIAGDRVSVFHLASVVSGAGERDFDLAMRVNVTGLLNVIDACRALPRPPRLVFTSSIAVFGGGAAGDTAKQLPSTTYGVTKTMGELLVNDATRRGFVDGRSARLPHVVIRPGPPNAAASGFASAVFREPLAGVDYALPVSLDTVMPVLGVRSVVAGIAALHDVDGEALGTDRAVGLPAIPVTVADMLESLQRVAGDRPLGTVTYAPDPFIQSIIDGWPASIDATRAIALGLPTNSSLDEIVEEYISDFV